MDEYTRGQNHGLILGMTMGLQVVEVSGAGTATPTTGRVEIPTAFTYGKHLSASVLFVSNQPMPPPPVLVPARSAFPVSASVTTGSVYVLTGETSGRNYPISIQPVSYIEEETP